MSFVVLALSPVRMKACHSLSALFGSSLTSSFFQLLSRHLPKTYSRQSSKRTMFTVIVEGNIGSGKTSMIDYFAKNHSKQIMALFEPIDKWRNLRGHNLFNLIKSDPVKYALPFQQLVQLTMAKTHRLMPPEDSTQSVRLMERSVFSARHVFVEALHKSKTMNDVEFSVYDEWYKFLVNDEDNKIEPDLIIYLKTSPELCLKRIKERDRKEETKLTIDYLKQLEELHENWLSETSQTRPAPVITISGDGNKLDMLQIFKQITPFMLGQQLPVISTVFGQQTRCFRAGIDIYEQQELQRI